MFFWTTLFIFLSLLPKSYPIKHMRGLNHWPWGSIFAYCAYKEPYKSLNTVAGPLITVQEEPLTLRGCPHIATSEIQSLIFALKLHPYTYDQLDRPFVYISFLATCFVGKKKKNNFTPGGFTFPKQYTQHTCSPW